MFAVLRVNTFDPDKLSASEDLIAEFDRIHAAQPGYVGSVVVDLGRGRRLALNLWDSIEHSQAALSVLGPKSIGSSDRWCRPHLSSSVLAKSSPRTSPAGTDQWRPWMTRAERRGSPVASDIALALRTGMHQWGSRLFPCQGSPFCASRPVAARAKCV